MMNNRLHPPVSYFPEERRAFLIQALRAMGATLLLAAPGISMAAEYIAPVKSYTVQDIIDILVNQVPGAPLPDTVDTLKSGDKNQQVTGVITTMFATVDIIRKAAALKANFIIAHEPTFYNHTDDVKWVEPNETLKEKQALLKRHNIAVWRFHDYIHSYQPDSVSYGVMQKAGWEKLYKENEAFRIPAMSLKNLALHLKRSLGIAHLRIIGNPDQRCSTLALLPGASGGQAHIAMAEKFRPDALIVGEVHEWETAEYIRDSRALGSKIALIILGHAVSEEPGMAWLQQWLQPRINSLTVTHLPAPDPFTWI